MGYVLKFHSSNAISDLWNLVAELHYIKIKEDHPNLEQQLNYYIENPDKASIIIENTNENVSQFFDEEREQLI